MTAVVHTRSELARARDAMTGRVAVVMTMGALHDGHRALLRAARDRAEHVVATVFVNPLQFGPGEDFDRYPRTLAADLRICAAEGTDVVFAPDRRQMYPAGEPTVRVNPGPLGECLEGASRPGFFHGVLTVVLKLLLLTRAELAFFGEKDYQQLALITLMVRDLEVPVQVIGVPTVREPDGLALSSRNRYLSDGQRQEALALSAALRAGAVAAARGAGPDGALAAAHHTLAAHNAPGAAPKAVADGTGLRLDYLTLIDPDLSPAPSPGPARLLVAAWIGTTRLIDNVPVDLTPGLWTEEAP